MDIKPYALPKPSASLEQKTITVNGQPLHFVHPSGDDTIFGTLSCIQNNKFHLDKVGFKPGDVFVDIGCNVGLLSLLVAHLVPGVKVYAFDASALAIDCLRRSIALNGLTNVQAYHRSVGAEYKKDVRFYSNGKDSSCLIQDGLNKDTNTVSEGAVDMISIDELFDSHLIDNESVHYLKLDVEGTEFAIFDHLFSSRPDILERIEYLHLEVHLFQELRPAELTAKVAAHFGDRVFFDT